MIFTASKNIQLQYNTWGNLKSDRVSLFFHGFPGAHIQGQVLQHYLEKEDAGLVAADRPGYGRSSFIRPGDFKTHAESLLELLDFLGVQKFSILGVSGGAPMAHMMTTVARERATKLLVICGLASLGKGADEVFPRGMRWALYSRNWIPPFFVTPFMNHFLKTMKPERTLARFISFLDETDKIALTQPKNQAVILDSMIEARRQLSKGIVWDSKIYAQDWVKLSNPENLKNTPVHYFHGKRDWLLPHPMAEYMHRRVPHSKLTLFEEEGHYSLAFGRVEEILSQ